MLIDKLNSLVTTGVIAAAVALSIRPEMPSGPLAFVTSSDERRNRTSSSVHRSCSGQEFSLLQLTGCPRGIGVVESC